MVYPETWPRDTEHHCIDRTQITLAQRPTCTPHKSALQDKQDKPGAARTEMIIHKASQNNLGQPRRTTSGGKQLEPSNSNAKIIGDSQDEQRAEQRSQIGKNEAQNNAGQLRRGTSGRQQPTCTKRITEYCRTA